MKTKILMLIPVVWSSLSLATLTGFPNAKLSGVGHWKGSQGGSGEFTNSMVMTSNSLTETLTFTDSAEVMELKTDYTFTQEGFFEVNMGGRKIGEGYCTTKHCHYEFEHEGNSGERTFIFAADGSVTDLGSTTIPGMRIAWETVLQPE